MLRNISIKTLSSAYKAETDPKVRERILMIKMLKEGKTSVNVGKEFSCPHSKVLYWKYRFEEEGLSGLRTREQTGRPPKIPKEKMERIRTVIDGKEWWTVKVVRELIHKEEGILYSIRHMQRLMHAWGFGIIRPSKKHVNKASKEEIRVFKKGLEEPLWKRKRKAGT